MEGVKLIMDLKIIVNQHTFSYGIKKKLLFETRITYVILYGCEVWRCSISRESWRKIGKKQKCFITYNLKIKGNTPYLIILIEVIPSPIESTTSTRYLK
jgi:hypothetical protein